MNHILSHRNFCSENKSELEDFQILKDVFQDFFDDYDAIDLSIDEFADVANGISTMVGKLYNFCKIVDLKKSEEANGISSNSQYFKGGYYYQIDASLAMFGFTIGELDRFTKTIIQKLKSMGYEIETNDVSNFSVRYHIDYSNV